VRGGLELSLHHGRDSDQAAPSQTATLPKGALRLSDLGFFSAAVLREVVAKGGHFLCRPRTPSLVTDERGRRWTLPELLAARCAHDFDHPVILGGREQLACRLLAQRVPPEIAALRRQRVVEAARREGTAVPRSQLALVCWEVFVTSLPPEQLTLGEALVLARLRWQIELLFKLWKRHGAIDEPGSQRPWQVLCAIYAKLLAVVVQHWMILVGCWPIAAKSLVAAGQMVRAQAISVILALRVGSVQRLEEALAVIAACLAVGCRMGTQAKRPHAYQLLLAASNPGPLS
jgi:Transposase DDE domain